MEVRAACAAEESYLRQLTLMDPRLVRLGGALMPCLSQARANEVALSIRTGGEDVDEQTARAWGELVRAVTAHSTPGTVVVAGVFPHAAGTRLSLVGEAEALDLSEVERLRFPTSRLDLGDQSLLELIVPGGVAAPPSDSDGP